MTDPDPTTEKAGARHNAQDMALLAGIHDGAEQIKAAALQLGHAVPEVVQTIKAGDVPDAANMPIIWGYIKAAGDWEIDVLANPYGGPINGRDTDGEFFSPRTKFHEDRLPYPPAVYYHGYDKDPITGKAKPTGMPEFLGATTQRWVDERGVWYRVVLDRASSFAKKVWDAAQRGVARASTGVVLATHRADKRTGEILSWMNGEVSIFETDTGKQPANSYAIARPRMKAVFAQAGLPEPDFTDEPATPETDATGATSPVAVARGSDTPPSASQKATEIIDMDKNEVEALIVAGVTAAMKAQQDAAAVEAERVQKETERIAGLEKAAEERGMKRAQDIANGRLPLGQAPYATKFAQTNKYDGLGVDDLAFMLGLLGTAKQSNGALPGVSKAAAQALAIKMAEDKTVVKRRNGEEINLGNQGRAALKAGGLDPADVLNATKADELNYSTQAGFGDEWVGVEYSNRLWEAIRAETAIVDKIPSIEVPQGSESIIIPLEGADPTWYKVGQTTDNNATTLTPNATVPASKLATDKKTLTVAKMGARTLFSGELVEDSLIPWAPQLRKQLVTSGAQIMEHVVIDGDTDASNATNINDIDGTPGATEVFLLLDGFRKSCLVTTTANSRSAGGSLVDTDFLNTIKLMGAAGLNAQDHKAVEFILDANTYWKALELASLKTKDVFSNATIEGAALTSVWGYGVRQSYFMHFESAKRMAENTGKIDQTDGDNTLGAILAVRYDQWLLGYKRRMTIELVRVPRSDHTEITALCRFGLAQRDTEASSITYNVGVA